MLVAIGIAEHGLDAPGLRGRPFVECDAAAGGLAKDADVEDGRIGAVDGDIATTIDADDHICDDPGEAIATDPTGDCLDSDSSVHPNAAEDPCNGVDDNCNNLIDELEPLACGGCVEPMENPHPDDPPPAMRCPGSG